MTAKTIKVCADEWKKLPWKKFQKNLFRLQHRIFKAAKKNDYDSVKRLQSLLLGSKCSKYLAVRQVTQLNAGKKTAGVDGIKSLNPKERLQLVAELDSMRSWKHRKLRKVHLPKAKGKQRLLGIATIRDRAMQCLVKYTLEPVSERYPGHSTWDVQNRFFQNLKSNWNGSKKTILKFDIEGCFENISHEKMMSFTTLPGVAKKFLHSALEAGVLKQRDKTLVGPVLRKIALDGIEDLGQKYQRGIRYADDMVFILMPGECVQTFLKKVKDFLHTRGLKAAEAKTRILSSLEGFNFLGWHFKVKAKNNKFVCYPSKKNRKQMIHKIKSVMKDTRYKMDSRLRMVKVIYKGWWNYHQFSALKQINLWSIRYWVYRYVRKSTNMPSKEIIKYLAEIFNGGNRHSSICGI